MWQTSQHKQGRWKEQQKNERCEHNTLSNGGLFASQFDIFEIGNNWNQNSIVCFIQFSRKQTI